MGQSFRKTKMASFLTVKFQKLKIFFRPLTEVFEILKKLWLGFRRILPKKLTPWPK